MDRSCSPRLFAAGSEQVLRQLTMQQHLKPSHAISQTLAHVCRNQGYPEAIGQSAIELLGIPHNRPSGRLSRQEICDLAQKIEFCWQVEVASQLRLNIPPVKS